MGYLFSANRGTKFQCSIGRPTRKIIRLSHASVKNDIVLSFDCSTDNVTDDANFPIEGSFHNFLNSLFLMGKS